MTSTPPPADRFPVVGIVGAGQLARMMIQAAIPLGIEVRVLAEHSGDSAALVSPHVEIGSPNDADALNGLAWLQLADRNRIAGRKGFEHVDDLTKLPGPQHPIVRTHPGTGRQALYLGRRKNSSIVDMALEESEMLLDTLWAHAVKHGPVYQHDWTVGDLVVWDNRCVMHRRKPFDPSTRRVMHRTVCQGERPY